jgi:hypothetical protein
VADGPLAAALAEAREEIAAMPREFGILPLNVARASCAAGMLTGTAEKLLAAVEAVLSAADGWKRFAAEGDAQDECAGELRKVIEAALTGKGNDGG